jgi:hypothetical protein
LGYRDGDLAKGEREIVTAPVTPGSNRQREPIA